jgi:uncharacterized protein (TIGR02118 family)
VKPGSEPAAKWVVMWSLPDGTDLESWNAWYWDEHVPLAKRLPGLRRYTTTLVHRTALGQPLFRIAEQYFDDLGALDAAINSEVGVALAADATPWVSDLGLYATVEHDEPLT